VAFVTYVLCFLTCSGLGEDSFALALKGPTLSGQEPVLVRGIVFFPKNTVMDSRAFQVLNTKGKACPADFTTTARWNSRSIRALAVKAVVKAGLARTRLRVVSRGSEDRQGGITSNRFADGSIEINTGALKALFSPTDKSLVSMIEIKGRKTMSREDGLFLRLFLNGETYGAFPSRQVLLKEGKAEAEVIIKGHTLSKKMGAGPEYDAHFYLCAGSALIRIRMRVMGLSFEGVSTGIIVALQPGFLGRNPLISMFGEGPKPMMQVKTGAEVTLHAGSRGVGIFYGSEEMTELGGQAAGMAVSSRGMSLYMGFPGFGMMHPFSVTHSLNEGFRISMLSDTFLWEKGLWCEREFHIFLKRGISPGAVPVKWSGPARCAAFGLPEALKDRDIPFMSLDGEMGTDPLFKLSMEVTSSLVSSLDRERIEWDGFWDYGDYRMESGQFANCEFDPAYGLIKRFMISGRIKDLSSAEIMLKHWLRFDRTGDWDLSFPKGISWVHGTNHRSGKVEPGHMWVDGALLFSRLTGEYEYAEAAKMIGDHLKGQSLHTRDRIRERSVSWSLIALTALVDAGMPGFEETMNRLAAKIRSVQADVGYFCFEKKKRDEVSLYAANSWVTSGITMEALYRHFFLTRDMRSMESLVKAAGWLKEACRSKTSGIWAQNLLYSTEDESLVIERGGRVKQEDACFLALGLARAGYVSGDAGLKRMARHLLEEGLRELQQNPPRYPGRALSVVMRSVFDVIAMTSAGS